MEASLRHKCSQSWLLDQSGTVVSPVFVTCVAERETCILGMSYDVKPTHQVSFLSVDSFWVQLFVQLC